MTLARALAALLLGLLVGGCSPAAPTAGTIPSIDDAHGFLGEIVRLAQRGEFDDLCARGDLNCQDSLEIAGRDAVPSDAPTVVGTRIVPTTSSGDQTSLGGVVLVLCGVDGRGAHYDSEMLVFHDGHGLRAINPVYWSRARIAPSGTADETSPPVNC